MNPSRLLSFSYRSAAVCFLALLGVSSSVHGQVWKKIAPLFSGSKTAEQDTLIPLEQEQMKQWIAQDIKALSAANLGGRVMGTKGEQSAGMYIGRTMNSFGVIPYDRNFIHTFWYTSGKSFTPETRFNIGRDYIFIPEDAFPTSYSGTGAVQNYILPDSREIGQPWIVPLYEEQRLANDPNFDWLSNTYKRAQIAIKRGASAIIFYDNYGSKYAPTYIKSSEWPALDVPVLILSHKAYTEKVKNIKSLTPLYLNIKFKEEQSKTANIIGYIDNGAPLDVLICAHYDGVATKENNISALGTTDNTSGVAAMIALARLLKKGRAKKYNYILAALSGGVAGQLGSKALLQDKSFDASKVAYVLNLDQADALHQDIQVYGATSAVAWLPFFKEPVPGVSYYFGEKQLHPSDNLTFLAREMPTLSFSTDTQPNVSSSVSAAGVQKTVILAYRFIAAMDRQPRPAFATEAQKEKMAYELEHRFDRPSPVISREQKAAPPAAPKRVISKRPPAALKYNRQAVNIGITCDTTYDGYGVRILEVKSSAQKAGLDTGDIIMQMGMKKINDMDDYQSVLRTLSPGEELTVKVKRGVTVQEFTLVNW